MFQGNKKKLFNGCRKFIILLLSTSTESGKTGYTIVQLSINNANAH